MVAASQTRDQPRSSYAAAWLGFGTLLGMVTVFASVVGWVALTLREDIRSQLMSRDARVLTMVMQHRIASTERELLVFEFETLEYEQLWEVALDTAMAEGVLAAQLFSVDGDLKETTSDLLLLRALPEKARAAYEQGDAHAVFWEKAALSDLMQLGYREDREVAVLDLFVPLRGGTGEELGAARFVMDGTQLAGEFSRLDRSLATQAAVAVGLGSVLIVGLFWLGWARLERAKRALQEQAKRLRRSNAELAMLARTSAVGSVAAHLIHGLKNPLAGLRQMMTERSPGSDTLASEDWDNARDAANRMQSMVQEVVALLQDSSSGSAEFELDLSEIADEIVRRFKTDAERRQAAFGVDWLGQARLDSHRANIVLLIVSNLAQNALDAAGDGGTVRVELASDGRRLLATVSDDGPGIAPAARERLFSPVTSQKEGGAGIGLAISMQLARHIGGSLVCVETTTPGASFELNLPLEYAASEGDRS